MASWTTSPTPTKTQVGSGHDLTLRQRINDAGVKTAMTGVEHFVDGNTSNTDYLYDNSGNLKPDLNKGISSIVYNHLNKPTLVTFSNGKKTQHIYDAGQT
ncbi:MAG: hypothetical protein SF052_09985 [Bacteroidia bacterium]|nr:hypothetical protein [Bacteroidia bacterium]